MMEIVFSGNKKVDAHVNGMVIKTDQSIHAGGEATAPEPFTLFLASMGTCAGIYVKSFCDQRGINPEGIKLVQTWNFNPSTRLIDTIKIDIQLPADFPEKYKEAVINTANLCAVKRHLQNPPNIEVTTSIK